MYSPALQVLKVRIFNHVVIADYVLTCICTLIIQNEIVCFGDFSDWHRAMCHEHAQNETEVYVCMQSLCKIPIF